MLGQLRFGRGLDNRRLKATGFEYGFTTRETVLKLTEQQRLAPVRQGPGQTYGYEHEVEDFLKRSPLVERDRAAPTEREPFGI